MPDRVRITDVSPRDGLQNEPGVIPTPDKARLVELLRDSGVDEVEVSSFVSGKWVPQLGDAAEVFAALAPRPPARPGPLLSALVPNEKGMRAALEVNARAGTKLISKVSVFTAASETFSHRNTNASIAETLRRFEPVIAAAKGAGLLVRGYISCVIECPFEGKIAPEKVTQVAQALWDLGCDEIDLGDTIGAAEPETIAILVNALIARLGDGVLPRTVLHLHDTFGRAVECIPEALSLGVRSFDGAAGGLGGCPYASKPGARAPGNISTELLVRTIHDAGYTTGVDPAKLAAAARFAGSLRSRPSAAATTPEKRA
jgi:hydroxymethylglutaryl-CoA lyase